MPVEKCLVTGGAGFIGSHLVDALIEEGHEVVVLDDLSTGKKENLNPEAKFHQVDIAQEPRYFLSFFSGVDWVFHLAAWARVPRSIEDPIGTNRVNVEGTLKILQACRQLAIKKLVLSSSSSVYGNQKSFKMVETMKPNPLSPYGLQKLIGEQYAQMFAELFKMNIIALRYFNAYGTRQLTEGAYSLVIGKFLDQRSKRLSMTIHGDGTQTRSYTHVSDVVEANLLAAKSQITGYEVMNIGTSEETSVNQIAEMIGGTTRNIIPNPRGTFEEKRKSADYSKAKKLLGWQPKVSIKEGIRLLLNE